MDVGTRQGAEDVGVGVVEADVGDLLVHEEVDQVRCGQEVGYVCADVNAHEWVVGKSSHMVVVNQG